MSEEKKNLMEEDVQTDELSEDELDQVVGGGMNQVHVNKTQDITQAMKDRA